MKFVLISVILLASFVVALSLKCYTCTFCNASSHGEATTCPSNMNTRCVKTWVNPKDGKVVINRFCGTQSVCDAADASCKVIKEQDLGDCAVGCCDSDLCNAGAVPSFSVLLVSLCSLFAVVGPFFK